MVPSFLKLESENEKLKLETVLFYDDTKGGKPHSKSIEKHLNKTVFFVEQKFRKLLDVANIDESSVDHHEIPKSRPQSFV